MADIIGAVIPAAGISSRMGRFKPLLPIGNETIIKRIVNNLNTSGVDKIVVISGYHHEELEKELSEYDVEIVFNMDFATTDMFHSIKLGLKVLGNSCDKVFFMPGDLALLSNDTLKQLLTVDADFVQPVFEGKSGHPVLLDKAIIPAILSYQGCQGLKGALAQPGINKVKLEVNDEGTIVEMNYRKDYEDILKQVEIISGTQIKLGLDVDISLGTYSKCFDCSTGIFMEIIAVTGSMSAACQAMHMSYTKGWNMINRLEKMLNIKILERNIGGASGGGSSLTDEGLDFLKRYQTARDRIQEYAQDTFNEFFSDFL